MEYAPLADIIDGFETARTWLMVRKGEDNWSLVGLDADGRVVHELEKLYYKQCEKIRDAINDKAKIVQVSESKKIIKPISVLGVLSSCLFHLTNGAEGTGVRSKETTVASVQNLIKEISQ